MFYKDSNNNKYYVGTPFTYNGNQYTKAGATEATFTTLGFTKVTIDPRPDDQFYIVSGPDMNGAYTSTDRNLDDLKTVFKRQQKQNAHQVLRQTDWYVIRSQELGVVAASVPGAVSTFRTAMRTIADARSAQIDACSSVQQLETLVKAPEALYDEQTQTYSQNPAGLTMWPEELAATYTYF